MTSLANNGHEVHDIHFLQDPQLRDSPCSRMSIQLLLCTVATLSQFWGLRFRSTCVSNVPSLTSFSCFRPRSEYQHTQCAVGCIDHSPFAGVLYAEPGVCKFRHRVITLLYIYVVIQKINAHQLVAAHHHGRRGVVPTRGESLPP